MPRSKTEAAQPTAEPSEDGLARYLGVQGDELSRPDLLPILCIARIQRIAAAIHQAQDTAARARGLYAGDIYTLFLLQRAPGRAARPCDLAAALTMTTGGMTKRLDRLEQAGMVRRDRDLVDRRGVVVALTERGLEAARSTRRARRRETDRLREGFSEAEWSTLAALLLRAQSFIEPEASPPV
ncbi:MAG: winged helix-turn-helix transcriptional regulator [Caulobacteraceae bacterium]|nr:winged helix-turn-helix transcriptional regulator [Caulobacteraceae bacterium]